MMKFLAIISILIAISGCKDNNPDPSKFVIYDYRICTNIGSFGQWYCPKEELKSVDKMVGNCMRTLSKPYECVKYSLKTVCVCR